MNCRSETSTGALLMDDFVAAPVGEFFVGKDLAGDEHVLKVIDVERYGWMYRHLCVNRDDLFSGDFFLAPAPQGFGW